MCNGDGLVCALQFAIPSHAMQLIMHRYLGDAVLTSSVAGTPLSATVASIRQNKTSGVTSVTVKMVNYGGQPTSVQVNLAGFAPAQALAHVVTLTSSDGPSAGNSLVRPPQSPPFRFE